MVIEIRIDINMYYRLRNCGVCFRILSNIPLLLLSLLMPGKYMQYFLLFLSVMVFISISQYGFLLLGPLTIFYADMAYVHV